VEPYRDNVVTFGHLLAGYDRACERFWKAATPQDSSEAFYPLFEALNWAVALDERVAAHWAPEGEPLGWRWRDRFANAALMRAVRFARNTVHHQWGDALVSRELSQVDFDLRPDAFGFARPTAESLAWVWRPLEDLRPLQRVDRAGGDEYRLCLAERPAALTLHDLQGVFWKLWHFLERPWMFPEPRAARSPS
jgi:hypothetical protein